MKKKLKMNIFHEDQLYLSRNIIIYYYEKKLHIFQLHRKSFGSRGLSAVQVENRA